jgi:hypothetical protein
MGKRRHERYQTLFSRRYGVARSDLEGCPENLRHLRASHCSGQQIAELVDGLSGLARYAEITGAAQPPPGLLAAAEQAVALPRRSPDRTGPP